MARDLDASTKHIEVFVAQPHDRAARALAAERSVHTHAAHRKTHLAIWPRDRERKPWAACPNRCSQRAPSFDDVPSQRHTFLTISAVVK